MTAAKPLWTWAELAAAVGAPAAAGPDLTGISIDTRTLRPGDLFVALPGDPGPRFNVSHRSTRDGHDFLPHAFAAGAAGALVHGPAAARGPTITVRDTLDALWKLAHAARGRFQGKVAAVTGSSGKTTAKTLLHAALADAFATGGSLNNHLGVPLSLARTPRGQAFAVYEIGTNHPGEIEPLARLAEPDVAIVLNVHPAHIEFFPDMAALRREKLSIAKGLRGGGQLVCLDTLTKGADVAAPTLTFGLSAAADVRLAEFDGATAVLHTPAGAVRAPVPGGGEHRALSVAAVTAALIALGVDPHQAVTRLAHVAPPAGRGNRIQAGAVTLIDDSYNANPASMAAALGSLAAAAPRSGRTIALLGEMLELGADSDRLHAELAPHCRGIDGVLCVGAAMAALHERLPAGQRLGHVEDAAALDAAWVAGRLRAGDMALIKGSNRVFWARGFAAALRTELEGGRAGAAQAPRKT